MLLYDLQHPTNILLSIYQSQIMLKLYWNIASQPARAVKSLLDLGNI